MSSVPPSSTSTTPNIPADIAQAASTGAMAAVDASTGNIPGAVVAGVVTAEEVASLVSAIQSAQSSGALTAPQMKQMWQALGNETETIDKQWQVATGSAPVN